MIEDEIANALQEHELASKDDTLKRLSDFYAEMRQSGVAQSRGYNLPPIDTIGNTVYRDRRH